MKPATSRDPFLHDTRSGIDQSSFRSTRHWTRQCDCRSSELHWNLRPASTIDAETMVETQRQGVCAASTSRSTSDERGERGPMLYYYILKMAVKSQMVPGRQYLSLRNKKHAPLCRNYGAVAYQKEPQRQSKTLRACSSAMHILIV